MGQILIGYHGCDITTRDGLVTGRLQPKPSQNPYDWLYDGMYFFEGDSARALKLAKAASGRPTQSLTRQPIATPAVVGVVLDIGVVAQMPVAAEVGSGDERDELGSG